jgi:hypothetical protein
MELLESGRNPSPKKIYYALRVASAMCFIGHGAFGIITKPIWCNYFGVVGIGHDMSYRLMPMVGSMDILMGISLLLYPMRAVFGWLVCWGLMTALMRPLSGEPFAEFIERAGNYGVPLAMLLLAGISGEQRLDEGDRVRGVGRGGWFSRLMPPVQDEIRKDGIKNLAICLRVVVFLVLAGHGWLNLIKKEGLLAQYQSLGIADPAGAAQLAGVLEVLAAIAVLVKPVRPLIFLLFLWKMATELFYPRYGIWEWIERGGSYGSLLALWWVTKPGATGPGRGRRTWKGWKAASIGVPLKSGKYSIMYKLLLIACLMTGLVACNSKKDYDTVFKDPNIYCATVYQLNTVVMGNNFGPIVASRNYLYAAVAGYEVIAGGYPERFNSLAGQLHGLGPVPKPAPGQKINFELASLLAYCKLGEAVTFPEGSMREYVDSLKRMATEHGMPSDTLTGSIAYGDTVASAIMAWSKKDRYLETRGAPEYMVDTTPGRWIPTPPAYTPAMEPHWSEIRYVVMDSVMQFIPRPPYKFDVKDKNAPYYQQVKLSQNVVDSLTPEQTWIADFWDDNPFKLNVSGHLMFGTKKFSPAGHWMSVTGIAARKAGADFQTTVAAYAKTAVALFDAFIQCWNIKYIYNTLRPETAINKYFDPNWRPHLQTPPFPEYTCGHCTISAAAAEALTSVFGDHLAYTDTTELEFGIKSRSFTSFRDAATETAHSRFYGGIHYKYSTEISQVMGTQVGDLVVDKLKMIRN